MHNAEIMLVAVSFFAVLFVLVLVANQSRDD
jgi:hypothetical protein